MNSVTKAVSLFVLVGAFAAVTSAQTDGPGNGPGTYPAADGQEVSTEVSTVPTAAGQLPSEPQIRQLGGAGFLASNFGLFHWGPLHLGSAEMYQSYDGIGDRDYWTTGIKTNFIFEERLRRSRIALQYSPKLIIENQQVFKKFSDQDSSLDTYYILTPRLSVGIADRFQIYNTNNLDADAPLSADLITSNTVQHAFLLGPSPSRYLQNVISSTFTYHLSQRTRVAFTPAYTYERVSGLAIPILSQTFSGSVVLERAMTATRVLGVYYGHEVMRVRTEDQSRPFVTPFNDAGINYSEQITPTWGVNGSFGVFTVGDQYGTGSSASANIGTTKSFGRQSVALAFERSHGLPGVVSRNTSTRVDLQYRFPLTSRIQMRLGSGYTGYNDISTHRVHGSYSDAELNWQMRTNVSWFVSYAYRHQIGDGNQISTLSRALVAIGIRWSPPITSR
jgi:hypothetical protein